MDGDEYDQHLLNLPQMKSIWLDEDQEAEKLYGLQAQQLMMGSGDSDDDGSMGIVMLNSNKPRLRNKQNIDLPPLHSEKHKKNPQSFNKKLKNSKLFAFLKNKESGYGRKILPNTISTPFGFQHISHAQDNVPQEKQVKEMPSTPEPNGGDDLSITETPFSKAFTTQCTSSTKDSRASRILSVARSSSIASSNYSKYSGAMSASSSARIVSSSTMATSLLDNFSPRAAKHLHQMEKTYLKQHKHNISESSSVSVDFLKTYNFPTLIENKQALDFDIPEIDKNHVESRLLPKFLDSPKLSYGRRNSDSQLIMTPQMENQWFETTTPKNRKSLGDDVLMYYLLPSDTDSPSRHNSCRSRRSQTFVKLAST